MKCWNKVVVMFVIGMLVFACGCGDTKEEAEEVTQAAGEERDMKENIPESIPENISEDVPENGSEEQEGKTADAETRDGNGGETAQAEDGDGSNSIVWDDITGEGIKTVHGRVESLADGEFTIVQIMTGRMEESGGEIAVEVAGAPGSEEDANLITVQYSEKAEFTVQTTTDGLTSTEREGSKEELKKDSSVILTGSWDGEIFRADKIVIFVVDM